MCQMWLWYCIWSKKRQRDLESVGNHDKARVQQCLIVGTCMGKADSSYPLASFHRDPSIPVAFKRCTEMQLKVPENFCSKLPGSHKKFQVTRLW